MRRFAQLASAGLWLVAGSLAAQGPPAGGDNPQPDEVTPLAVPYLAQTQLLCGGAALAMVERWWGRRGVFAEDFAALVRPASGGIRTTDLAAAARSRGFDARETERTADAVRGSLRAGVPVIALIEVARDRYHFVVLLAWAGGQVEYHDPAEGPNRTASESQFLARWTGARRWALAVRPDPAAARLTPALPGAATAAATPCAPWLDRAIDAAVANRLEDAVILLEDAGRACPSERVITRELSAVRFRQRRYTESIRLARDYLALAPDDTIGWQLLASGRYLVGDRNGALEAWNRIGRPVIDFVRIDGSRNIRFKVLADHIDAPLGVVLSPRFLELARRRLSDVPGVRNALVDYEPVPGGLAEVRVAIDERPVVDPVWLSLVRGATGAVAQDEVAFAVASPTRLGELWSARWRWEPARPRVALRVDLPATLAIPGVIHLAETRERFRFALGSSGVGIPEVRRRSVEAGFGGWMTAAVRPSVSMTYDRWSEDRRYVAVSAAVDVRARQERFRLKAGGAQAFGFSGARTYTQLDVGARWASASGIGRPSWSARAGVDRVSDHAPLGTWPIAGTNFDWTIPLRAHSATPGGLIDPRSAGRRIIHAGLTADRPVRRFGLLIVSAGAFLDGAEIANPADVRAENGWLLDAGGGLRVGVGDGRDAVFRIDWAGSITDGRTALSVGLQREWPPFE